MTKIGFKQTMLAVLGTIILTSTALAAAVGPARALETAPAASLVA